MNLLPPSSTTHWVYDDPSGVPEPYAAATPIPKPERRTSREKTLRGKILPFPTPRPATPKAA